jgi:hypothetical protein
VRFHYVRPQHTQRADRITNRPRRTKVGLAKRKRRRNAR